MTRSKGRREEELRNSIVKLMLYEMIIGTRTTLSIIRYSSVETDKVLECQTMVYWFVRTRIMLKYEGKSP